MLTTNLDLRPRVPGTLVGLRADISDGRTTTTYGVPLHDVLCLIPCTMEGWYVFGWDDESRIVSPQGRMFGCEPYGDPADGLWTVYDVDSAIPGGSWDSVTGDPVCWRYVVAILAGLIMIECASCT